MTTIVGKLSNAAPSMVMTFRRMPRPVANPLRSVSVRGSEPTVHEIELGGRIMGPCRRQHGGAMCRQALVGGGYNQHLASPADFISSSPPRRQTWIRMVML